MNPRLGRRANIQVIFWDFGNVCATFDFERFVSAFSKHVGNTPEEVRAVLFVGDTQVVTYAPLFRALECGEVTPCQFFSKLTDALGCSAQIDYATFAHMWADIFLKENIELCELMERIPLEHYLLSNTNEIVRSRYVARSSIVRTHIRAPCKQVLSHSVGAMKPDPRIYTEALRRVGIPASQCLFVDDVNENINAWRLLGGHGIVYNAKHDWIDDLEAKLRHTGVLIN